KPLELVDGAPREIFAFMMLDDHHADVVDLDGVRQGHQRTARGVDEGGLVVIDPVADIFYSGIYQELRGFQGLGEAWPEPPHRPLAGETLEDVEGTRDHAGLVLDLVNWDLIVAVTHELPAEAFSFLRNAGVVLAGARVDGQCGGDAEPLVELEEAPGTHAHA